MLHAPLNQEWENPIQEPMRGSAEQRSRA
jgi:hypothetical protein